MSPARSTFHIDAPDRRKKKDPVELDPNRVFYIRDASEPGEYPGGFRYVWEDWEVDKQRKIVRVYFTSGRMRVLTGEDARKFLKIVRDSYAHTLFDD